MKKDLNVLYQVCVFGPIGKTRWRPWPLICWYIFDFVETAERNSMKLDRKQNINVLYQVCDFRADRKNRWAPWPLVGWDFFYFSTERNSTKFDMKKDLNVLYQVYALGRSIKQDGGPGLWLAETFSTSLKLLNWIQWLDRKQNLNVFYRVCDFRADRKNTLGRGRWDLSSCQVYIIRILWDYMRCGSWFTFLFERGSPTLEGITI